MVSSIQISIGSSAIKTKTIGIPLTGGVTFIGGESGSSKTFLFNRLSTLIEYDGMRVIPINRYNYSTLKDLNTVYNKDCVILDRFDEIREVFPECIELLNKHHAPVIIFGRSSEGLYQNQVPIPY
jgi:hypothetical protein